MIFNNINTCNSQFSNVTKNSHISRREHLELLLKHVRVKTFTIPTVHPNRESSTTL